MKRTIYITLSVIGALIALPILTIAAILIIGSWVNYDKPEHILPIDESQIVSHSENCSSYNGSSLIHNEHDIWELRLIGRPEERGTAYAALAKELIQYQESSFVNRIKELIPSDTYLNILRRIVMFSNRSIDEYIPEEVKCEIYNMSQACSHEYDNLVGNAYGRQLNYHGAHDIGHAMQRYMLVGCTAFAAWDSYTTDSAMLVGRNFDFYFGDDFARHMMVVFVNPTEGLPFISVSWPAMIGVVSGMNTEGITVTLNAAEGPLNITGRTPVSILARQIIQYASTIDEAISIASQNETFVSEQIFVCSAKERKAAVIEKSPDNMSVLLSDSGCVALTNHYRSDIMKQEEPYPVSELRLQRAEELIHRYRPLDISSTVKILRDYKGVGDKSVPLGSEEAICQFVSHHSVIFAPDSLRMWVTTPHKQTGHYICYDLRQMMSDSIPDKGFAQPQHIILPDSTLHQYYISNNQQQ